MSHRPPARPLSRTLAPLAAAGCLAASVLVAAPAQAAEPTGVFDLVVVGHGTVDDVGLPVTGYVDVRLPNGTTQHLTRAGLGLPAPTAGADGFGTAVAVGDLNNDGRSDLVVGANGVYADGSAGAAWALLAGTDGQFDGARVTELAAPHGAGAKGAQAYGSAVAISRSSDAFTNVWVSDPTASVNGQIMAGAVYRFTVTPAGVPTFREQLTQDSPGFPGVAEEDDAFGQSLAPAWYGVVIGSPGEAVGAATGAGSVYSVSVDPDTGDVDQPAQVITQNSAGVPGTAEKGDRFGASIAPGGQAVGVPGEDLGTVKDAGIVQLFKSKARGVLTPAAAISQDSKGVPGTAEKGDLFGLAVTAGTFTCQEQSQIAVGAPGESIGSAARAGSVTLLPSAVAAKGCKAVALSQGSGLPGSVESEDGTGRTLAVVNGDPELEEDRYDALLVGVPTETVGAASQAGRVLLVRYPGKRATSFGPLTGGDTTHAAYGRTLGRDAE